MRASALAIVLETFADGHEANVTCLEELGFTRPCAQIWAYNTAL